MSFSSRPLLDLLLELRSTKGFIWARRRDLSSSFASSTLSDLDCWSLADLSSEALESMALRPPSVAPIILDSKPAQKQNIDADCIQSQTPISPLDGTLRAAPPKADSEMGHSRRFCHHQGVPVRGNIGSTGRFSPPFDQKAPEGTHSHTLKKYESRLKYLNDHLDGRDFLLDGFTVADAYLYTVLNWTAPTRVDLARRSAQAQPAGSGRRGIAGSQQRAIVEAEQRDEPEWIDFAVVGAVERDRCRDSALRRRYPVSRALQVGDGVVSRLRPRAFLARSLRRP